MKRLLGILFLFSVMMGFAIVPTSFAYGCSHEVNEKTALSNQKRASYEKTYHQTAAKEDAHKNHSCPIGGCGDDCNCGCGCIHSQTSIFTGFGVKSLISILLPEETLPELYRNFTLQSYHTDIWQPPKC